MTLVFFPQYALLPALTLNTYFIEVIQLRIMAKFLTHAEAPFAPVGVIFCLLLLLRMHPCFVLISPHIF